MTSDKSQQYIQRGELKLLTGNANTKLAESIAKSLNTSLGEAEIEKFSDGEIKIKINESIRGKDVYIVQPTSSPTNDNLMELLIMIDACRRASAGYINVIVPYYGYARQDRKARSREPITAKLVANLIETAGANRMIALDLHAPQIQGFFDIPIDHLMGVPIIGQYFENDPNINPEECVVVSPDHGGVTRARKLADILKTPIAIIDKRRPKPNVAEVMNIVGEIEGRTAIIIDDIIDTAGTITLAAQALKDKGAKDVYACCTHPVLSGPAKERIENSAIKELIVTNSILLDDSQKPSNIKELSVAGLIAQAIVRVYERESVSVLFD